MIGMPGGQSFFPAGVIVALAAIAGAACFTPTRNHRSRGCRAFGALSISSLMARGFPR
jgi:hypothetical protein